MKLAVGDRVRTPEGWEGEVRTIRRQEVPHGGVRGQVGIGAKPARPGEIEALLAEHKTYAFVVLDRGGGQNYNVDVLGVIK